MIKETKLDLSAVHIAADKARERIKTYPLWQQAELLNFSDEAASDETFIILQNLRLNK